MHEDSMLSFIFNEDTNRPGADMKQTSLRTSIVYQSTVPLLLYTPLSSTKFDLMAITYFTPKTCIYCAIHSTSSNNPCYGEE